MGKRSKEQEYYEWIEWLEERYDHWLADATNGLTDPNYPDGYNMNFVRNHIIYYKGRILKLSSELSLPLPPVSRLPIPPVVPDNYMVKERKYQERRWELLEEWNPTTKNTFTYDEKDFVYKKHTPDFEQLSFSF